MLNYKQMGYSNKIKNYQPKSEVEINMTQNTWLNIYNLMSTSLPGETTIEGMIRVVQEKLNFKENGKPGIKTWRALCKLIIGEGRTATQKNKTALDPHNEDMLSKMTKEIAPFAKELIYLAQEQGINIRLLRDMSVQDNSLLSLDSFGLTFDIGVFDQTTSGELIYNGNLLRYANVAKLAESIGLTWAADQKKFTNQSRFELRPAWALRMSERDMLNELQRRKEANLNLLAMLD